MNPYEVSTTGVVTRNGKIIKTHLSAGYPSYTEHINNKKRAVFVHRKVAETCIPNPLNNPLRWVFQTIKEHVRLKTM